MKFMKKIVPWLIGSLMIIATSAFAEAQNRYICKTPAPKCVKPQPVPGYNAPARIDVRGSWNVFLSGSFILWNLSQDNMSLAFADGLSNASYIQTNQQINGQYVGMDFNFKPGFKAGLGFNTDQDDWDIYSEYTWLHESNNLSTTGQTLDTGVVAPLFATWGDAAVLAHNAYNNASQTWQCNLDFVDLSLGRAYYVGSYLTFHPFFGMRGAWIIQDVNVQYINSSFSNASSPLEVPGTLTVIERIHSWGLGPRIGLDTNWNLGVGIRLFGNANADLLYTKYTLQNKINFLVSQTVGSHTNGSQLYTITHEDVSALRAHLDLEMGFGWGTYFDNNNWHFDLAAAWGFQAFFDQNMFTRFFHSPVHKLEPTGNLYAQGLTFTARFDF